MTTSNLNADGRPSLWYVLATGEVRGWGWSTFEYDAATEAVIPCDGPLPADPHTMRHFRNADGSIRAEPRGESVYDIIVDDSAKGLILKDMQATPHYWRFSLNNSGVLVTTDIGTTKP